MSGARDTSQFTPLDWMRLGARAMRRSAEASCGNHAEGAMEDAMTSAGLTPAKIKLGAEARAAEHIERDIRRKVEDSAFGYASYMGSEDDRAILQELGVNSGWLYRKENGQPSRKELADAEDRAAREIAP